MNNRRAGRFDREISLGIPTEAAREQILRVLTRPLRLQGDFDYAAVARRTPGFVGADLAALAKEAAAAAVTRIFNQLDAASSIAAAAAVSNKQSAVAASTAATYQPTPMQQRQQQQVEFVDGLPALLQPDATDVSHPAVQFAEYTPHQQHPSNQPQPQQQQQQGRLGGGPLTAVELSGLAISMDDFETALPKVQPSVRREGFTTKPDVTWDDVGSLQEVSHGLPGLHGLCWTNWGFWVAVQWIVTVDCPWCCCLF